MIKIHIYDKHHLCLSTENTGLLDLLKARMDGYKLRNQNSIVVPLKTGPKIFKFKPYGIEWSDDIKNLIYKLSNHITKRKQIIEAVKAQYGNIIKFDYECKGIYKPMEHQKIIFNMITSSDVCAILAEPGTCKTGPYLWAIDKRIQNGEVKKALIITLSGLKENVIDEMVNKQVPHLKGVILDSKSQAKKILNKEFKDVKKNIDYDVYIANYESMFSLVELFDDNYFDMVILDEAHRIGSPTSRQTKSIIDKFENTKYKYIITGTLNANNCLSFFMPFRFLGPDVLPSAGYTDFRQTHMYPLDKEGYIWEALPGTKMLIQKVIGNVSVFFAQNDCLDLPEVIYQRHHCVMDKQQEKYYTELKNNFITQFDNMCGMCDKKGNCDNSCNSDIMVKNALSVITKLQQIACGFYINTVTKIDESGKETQDRNIITFDNNPKLDLLIQTLNNLPEYKKIIIWTHFVHGIDMIKSAIDKTDLGKYITIYQDENAFERVKQFEDPEYRFLIANPTKGGVGLNIEFSNYQVFFSNSYSYIQRDQAIARQHRQGQKHNVNVIDLLVNGTIDMTILQVLQRKGQLSSKLNELANMIKSS